MDRQQDIRYTQNFLHSPALVGRIVALAGLAHGATVLEIGPGKGIITAQLAAAVGPTGHVSAVELDPRLAVQLTDRFRDTPQVEIIPSDILRFDFSRLPSGYAAFSNVPFNITSALLERLFTPDHGPAHAHLILQKETLIAADVPGGNGETFKSLMLAPLYRINLAHTFRRNDFTPPPGVDTALFAFEKHAAPLVASTQYGLYKDFLAAVSKDRAGEGIWRRLFSAAQMNRLAEQAGLVMGRGLKSQSAAGITAAFRVFAQGGPSRHTAVTGAMAILRAEQERREQINRSGGHRPRR